MLDSPHQRAMYKRHEEENSRWEKYINNLSAKAQATAASGQAWLKQQQELTEAFAHIEISLRESNAAAVAGGSGEAGSKTTTLSVQEGVASMNKMLRHINSLQMTAIGQMLDVVDKYVDTVQEQQLHPMRDRKRSYKIARNECIEAEDKYLALPQDKASEEKIQGSRLSLLKSRAKLRCAAVDYGEVINRVATQRPQDHVEALLDYANAFECLVQQGTDYIQQAAPAIDIMKAAIDHSKQLSCASAQMAETVASNLLSIAQEQDNSNGTPAAYRGRSSRCGYLYAREKGLMGALGLGDSWHRVFCRYVRDIGGGGGGGRLFLGEGNAEGIAVQTCSQRFAETTGGRRHCFEITTDGGITHIFQAATDTERYFWVCAMGGQAPKKTIRLRGKQLQGGRGGGGGGGGGGSGGAAESKGLTGRGLMLLQQLIAHIEAAGLDEEGLYRLPGVKTEYEKLVTTALSPKGKLPNMAKVDLLTASSALKFFLRSMPEPLLTFSAYHSFIAAGKCTSVDEAIPLLRKALQFLPPINREVAQLLFGHLAGVAAHATTNKMTATNLAVVFGPTLLYQKNASNSDIMTMVLYQNTAIEYLINGRARLFGDGEETAVAMGVQHFATNPVSPTSPSAVPVVTLWNDNEPSESMVDATTTTTTTSTTSGKQPPSAGEPPSSPTGRRGKELSRVNPLRMRSISPGRSRRKSRSPSRHSLVDLNSSPASPNPSPGPAGPGQSSDNMAMAPPTSSSGSSSGSTTQPVFEPTLGPHGPSATAQSAKPRPPIPSPRSPVPAPRRQQQPSSPLSPPLSPLPAAAPRSPSPRRSVPQPQQSAVAHPSSQNHYEKPVPVQPSHYVKPMPLGDDAASMSIGVSSAPAGTFALTEMRTLSSGVSSMDTTEYVALYDCVGEDASELSFRKGDIIVDGKFSLTWPGLT